MITCNANIWSMVEKPSLKPAWILEISTLLIFLNLAFKIKLKYFPRQD